MPKFAFQDSKPWAQIHSQGIKELDFLNSYKTFPVISQKPFTMPSGLANPHAFTKSNIKNPFGLLMDAFPSFERKGYSGVAIANKLVGKSRAQIRDEVKTAHARSPENGGEPRKDKEKNSAWAQELLIEMGYDMPETDATSSANSSERSEGSFETVNSSQKSVSSNVEITPITDVLDNIHKKPATVSVSPNDKLISKMKRSTAVKKDIIPSQTPVKDDGVNDVSDGDGEGLTAEQQEIFDEINTLLGNKELTEDDMKTVNDYLKSKGINKEFQRGGKLKYKQALLNKIKKLLLKQPETSYDTYSQKEGDFEGTSPLAKQGGKKGGK